MDLFDRFVERTKISAVTAGTEMVPYDPEFSGPPKTKKPASSKSDPTFTQKLKDQAKVVGKESKEYWKKLPTLGKAGIVGAGALTALGVGNMFFGSKEASEKNAVSIMKAVGAATNRAEKIIGSVPRNTSIEKIPELMDKSLLGQKSTKQVENILQHINKRYDFENGPHGTAGDVLDLVGKIKSTLKPKDIEDIETALNQFKRK